ncbi:DNA polymerase [Ktedonosporobacter rubrisoli]|uniref:DNA-directed DNA polymerase n=1 Tax=Ktedonosporobacter rubrisoli TaxID=2509675 RepID=A0A4P6JUM6_KTERU|nr:DNA polymerase domain-containing protein [Ktedonosporobacter rubrisoli]QBD79002.1 DNA polymerase [Ktedonosporobacter rubrisoli]
MQSFSSIASADSQAHRDQEWLFGWDPTPGIVSVWAQRDGRAIIWRRDGEKVHASTARFRPWLLATHLQDLAHLGPALQEDNERAGISYQRLTGPEGSYRYLLSSYDGRRLERAVLDGATRRLGQPVQSINSLTETYYRVGPVEQYLIQTGCVYFRGLTYENLYRLQFDLETTALDPHRGRIFLVAIRDNHGFESILEAPRPEDEKQLIVDLCELIRTKDPDVLENHNLFGFDLPFLEQRASKLGVPLLLGRRGAPLPLERYQETLAIGPEARKRTRYSVAGRELIDTLDAVRRHDFVVRDMPSYSLKDVARYFGIASAERVYIEGSAIFETYRRNPEMVKHYALDDVAEVDGLSLRLLGAPFSLASMAPRRYERLASAGPAMGILEPMLVRAYLHTNTALPCQSGQQPTDENLHAGGAVHLFESGIAEHVVKADVASLYPSLMRTFQIGPASDHLGVLLSILGRLTDLRLTHKAAARTADEGSVEARHHEATQAAMKILINAAYGYMGAGSMALFADNRAAGEVTRRGREILTQVLDALRQRGMALIEADTDGVYFAVPSDWSEEQERGLVREIGEELPNGIRLEYEGRYRAMLSHEVKNYALLTYSGRLIVHGVALRSSRTEPFGERFLRQALTCAMTGDIVNLHNIYLEIVYALRQRKLLATDLATRVRLSKTPETYMAARANHPEPAYEALLNARRTQWYPGERVRFYRTKGKRYIWLPEETAETATYNDWQEEKGQNALPSHDEVAQRRDYDVDHYLQVLVTSYAARLRKAFAPDDFAQLFRLDGQPGLFDQPIENIQPRWIRCRSAEVK